MFPPVQSDTSAPTPKATKNPSTFHQSQDTSGANFQTSAFPMSPATKPEMAPFSLANRVRIPNKNMARMGPLASEPTLFTDSITELEMSPTKNEKITMSVPQKTVKNRDRLSCLSAGISPFWTKGS